MRLKFSHQAQGVGGARRSTNAAECIHPADGITKRELSIEPGGRIATEVTNVEQ
jgi:hypothetical protein